MPRPPPSPPPPEPGNHRLSRSCPRRRKSSNSGCGELGFGPHGPPPLGFQEPPFPPLLIHGIKLCSNLEDGQNRSPLSQTRTPLIGERAFAHKWGRRDLMTMEARGARFCA